MSPGFDHVRCMILSRPGLKQPNDIIPVLCVSADEPHTYMFSGSHGRDATGPSPITHHPSRKLSPPLSESEEVPSRDAPSQANSQAKA